MPRLDLEDPRDAIHGDVADRAASLTQAQELQAIAKARELLSRPGCADCTDCHEPISSERRAALPSARRCADCQGMAEMRSYMPLSRGR